MGQPFYQQELEKGFTAVFSLNCNPQMHRVFNQERVNRAFLGRNNDALCYILPHSCIFGHLATVLIVGKWLLSVNSYYSSYSIYWHHLTKLITVCLLRTILSTSHPECFFVLVLLPHWMFPLSLHCRFFLVDIALQQLECPRAVSLPPHISSNTHSLSDCILLLDENANYMLGIPQSKCKLQCHLQL